MFVSTAQPFDVATPEFKAIILAGPGSDLYPLTERENTPKALLPIANKPMIWYTLQWLEQGGVLDVEIVTVRESEPEISNYIRGVYEGMANITVREVNEAGTADALRQVAPQIKTDVIVVPCDLIIDVPAAHFLDLFRLRRPSVATMFYEAMKSEGGGGTSKASTALPCIGIDQPSSRLVMLKNLDKSSEELSMRMSLIRKFPSLAVSNKMQDSHVYVFQRWVLDYLLARPELSSLQDDLLPLLVRAQSQPQLLEREGITRFMRPRYARDHIDENDTSAQFGLPDGTDLDELDDSDPLKVFVYIRRGGIAGRGNRIPQYCDLNRIVTRISTEARVEETVQQAQRIQVGSDSMVGAYSKLGERCSVKRSVVGAHCVIGKNVKITNSIIMDHVTIADGVKLESCVVCKLAKIGDKAQLKDCEIGASVAIPNGSNIKGEMFAASSAASNSDGIQVKFN